MTYKVRSLLHFLSFTFLLNGIVNAKIENLKINTLCEIDLIKFVEFSHHRECLQITPSANTQPSCISEFHTLYSLSLQIRSYEYLEHRNIISYEYEGKCETFLIFIERMEDITEMIELDQRSSRYQFFPFSKLNFYVVNEHFNDSATNNMDVVAVVKNWLNRNALFGYLTQHRKGKMVIRDLLTNDVKRSISSYLPSDLLHPIVDTRLAKDNFRISLFNCKPFTIYPENASDSK